jgi:acyl-ACP thioesterase
MNKPEGSAGTEGRRAPLDLWGETCPVRFGHIDRSDRLTLDAVLRFFQEAAISHAENLGVGREAMARSGQVWILSRMSAVIHRRPAYGETVTVRSWPRGWEKLFALRDYDIRDASDTPVVQGRSGWLILDIEKRRPLRPRTVMDRLPLNDGLDALPFGPGGLAFSLAERADLRRASERAAAYSDVDYNGHVNNISYVQWIEDALRPGLLEQAGRMRLDISYLSEVLPGEVTVLWSAPISAGGNDGGLPEHAFAFEGRKSGGAGSAIAFRAELCLWP